VETSVSGQEGEAAVVYRVVRGPRQRIGNVAFKGNNHFRAEELKNHVAAGEGGFLNRGRYDEASIRQLTAFYRSQGFNEANVTATFVPAGARDLILTFEVNEGARDVVETLQVSGNEVPMAKLVPDGLRLGPGKPFSQSALDEDKSQIVASYLDLGYLAARVHQTSQPLSSDPHRFQVLYEITEGPQVQAGRVVTLGRDRTKQTLIDRQVAPLRPGAPVVESEIFASESRLFAQGVFDWSQVNLRRRIGSADWITGSGRCHRQGS
jgi:outer membrane protein assembly factor BamA